MARLLLTPRSGPERVLATDRHGVRDGRAGVTLAWRSGPALAAVNVFGGFLVTQRMLEMFKKKEPKAAKAGEHA